LGYLSFCKKNDEDQNKRGAYIKVRRKILDDEHVTTIEAQEASPSYNLQA